MNGRVASAKNVEIDPERTFTEQLVAVQVPLPPFH
jgi:hypothetical protein